MSSKIRFETDEDTSGEDEESIQVDRFYFPQFITPKEQIKRIQDLMEESGEPVQSVFKGRRTIIETRKEIKGIGGFPSKKKPDFKNNISKGKKPDRKF